MIPVGHAGLSMVNAAPAYQRLEPATRARGCRTMLVRAGGFSSAAKTFPHTAIISGYHEDVLARACWPELTV